MTREELIKKRWKGYEIINYMPKRKEGNELFMLEPFDKEAYEDKTFWARVEYCKRPSPKLKVLK